MSSSGWDDVSAKYVSLLKLTFTKKFFIITQNYSQMIILPITNLTFKGIDVSKSEFSINEYTTKPEVNLTMNA